MSIKSIAKKAGRYVVSTVNGGKTSTGTFYVKELKTYTPLANGFNKELADEVLDIITANQELWDQGVWRRVFDLTPDDDYIVEKSYDLPELATQIKAMAAFNQDLTSPSCGTAMCFAGWVAELTGADWVVDSTVVKAYAKGKIRKSEMDRFADNMLILRNPSWRMRSPQDVPSNPVSVHARTVGWSTDHGMSNELATIMARRGFSPDLYRLGTVDDYASEKLGGIEGSTLFEEYNDLDAITKIVGNHVDYGPSYYADRSEQEDYDDDDEE